MYHMDLRALLAEILDIPPESINEKTSPENTPSWDSFNGLLIASELEKAAGVKFSIEDVLSVKNVGDIKKVLDRYNVVYDF